MVECEPNDSAAGKILHIFRLLVHDKKNQPLPEDQVSQKSMRHKLVLWHTKQLPKDQFLLKQHKHRRPVSKAMGPGRRCGGRQIACITVGRCCYHRPHCRRFGLLRNTLRAPHEHKFLPFESFTNHVGES